VSTIFYLMSLQAMAQAPFRVVDEINQGMDLRNERMVHARMVEIACREHTSQYFLITPKLLPGLRYDERMRVHTIVSGEHVPGALSAPKMDFAKFAKIHRRVAPSWD
jgi:structural maintenance of chromosomes protein 5